MSRSTTWRHGLLWAGIVLLALAGTLASVIGVAYVRSPVGALDMADGWLPGGGAARVLAGVPFGHGNRLDVWATPAPAGRRRPIVIFFYGGSWVNGQRQDYGFVGRAFADAGFVTVIPDYRKVPEVRFPAFLRDGAAAVGWARANAARTGGDPDRILLAGHSAGAWIATMLALDRRYLAAAHVPAGAVRAAAGLAGPYDFHPFTWPAAQAAMGAARDPRDTQPIAFARADAPPLWLATGTADETIQPRNAFALAARQHAVGADGTVLRTYPGLGHAGIVMAFSRPFRGKAPVLADSVAFFRAHLADRHPAE